MRPLIALHGKYGSGKTTLANALSAKYDIGQRSFAAPLRNALWELGLSTTGRCKDRQVMQDIGTYLTDRDGWHFCRLMDERTPNKEEEGLVIDDLRRPEEWIWAKVNGFWLVKLEISARTQEERGYDLQYANHKTETALDYLPNDAWDIVLPEGTTVEERVQIIDATIRHVGENLIGAT